MPLRAADWLAAFWLPFYLGGYWLIYQGLKRAFPTWAKLFFFPGVYGVIMGSPIAHTVLTLNPLIYKFGVEHGASELFSELITSKIVPLIKPVFATHYLLAFVFPPLIFFFTVLSGKTEFKKWLAFLNSLFIAIFFISGIFVFPKIFMYLLPGSINKGMAVFFLIGAVTFWNKSQAGEAHSL